MPCEDIDKGHGRIEHRFCYVSDQIDWLTQRKQWQTETKLRLNARYGVLIFVAAYVNTYDCLIRFQSSPTYTRSTS